MIELPKGWTRGNAGELCAIVGGATPRTNVQDYWGGDIPWLTPDDLSRDRRKYVGGGRRFLSPQGLDSCGATLVPAGTVLLTSRAPIGYTAIASRPVATNQGFKSLVPSNGLSSEFLYWQVQHLTDIIRGMGSGTTFAEVSKKVMATVPLKVAPLPEQKRIVAAIEEAFCKLEAGESGLRAVRQLLKRTRDAVLAAAVTGRLALQDSTDTPAAKLRADLRAEARPGPPLPSGWAWSEVGDLLARIEAGKSFATLGHPAQANEIGVVKVSAMTWGEFRAHENKAIPAGSRIDPRWTIRAGDLLFSRANTSEYVGACVLVRKDHSNLILSDKSLRLVPEAGVSRAWLLYYLRSAPARDQIEVLATGTKESMRNISQAKLRGILVGLPPVEEQHRIVEEVERQFSFLDACERAVEAGLARSAALRRSVLTAAFEGELVPQDPGDESASVLLERIRAERAAAPKPTRRTRRTA